MVGRASCGDWHWGMWFIVGPGSGKSMVGLSDRRGLFQHKLFHHSSLLWMASASTCFPLTGRRDGLRFLRGCGSSLLSALLSRGWAGEGFKTLFRSLAMRKGALAPYCLITHIQVHLQDLSQQIYLYFLFFFNFFLSSAGVADHYQATL